MDLPKNIAEFCKANNITAEFCPADKDVAVDYFRFGSPSHPEPFIWRANTVHTAIGHLQAEFAPVEA